MSTAILNYPLRRKLREQVLSVFASLVSYLLVWTRWNFTSRSDCAVSEFERALRTVAMAGNPGEDYAILADRIEREAAAYKRFLENPQRIGRISLNVKLLGADDDVYSSHEQYRVKDPVNGEGDPAEGNATFGYTYNRSDNKVLEFFVHDENDEPIFPIARTYTNWIGAKSFDLGDGRKFYLSMVEQLPGYVFVRAGFSPFAEVTDQIGMPECKPWSMSAGAGGGRGSVDDRNPIRRFFGIHIPEFATDSRLAVNLLLGLLWLALAFAFVVRPASRQSSPNGNGLTHLENETMVTGNQQSGWFAPDATIPPRASDNIVASIKPSTFQLPALRFVDTGKARRLAAIKTVRIIVDNSACNANGGRCHKLLDGVKEKMHDKLGGKLPMLPVAKPDNEPPPYELVVSYLPLDWQHGQVHISLFDQEGSLWDGEQGFAYAEDDEGSFISVYSTQVARQILSQIQYAREQVGSTTPVEQAEETTATQ